MAGRHISTPLTPKEFVVAGLLNEAPSHGYELEQKIQSRGMRDWTQIGFSSIYHVLKKLKQRGYVTQRTKTVRGKLQQIFSLTDTGKRALQKRVRTSVATIEKNRGEFDVAIINTMDMPSVRIRGLLQKRIRNLENTVQELELLRKRKLQSGMPNIPAVTILFDRPIALLKAEKKFMDKYIDRF